MPATVTIQHVYDLNDADHYVSATACAQALVGKLRVKGIVAPDIANVAGSILYDDPILPGEFLNYPAELNTNHLPDNTWECVWNNVPNNTYRFIRINAQPNYTGTGSSDLHIVTNYNGNECPTLLAHPSEKELSVVSYIEVIYAPQTVVSGETFWVIVRGEPVASAPTAHDGALPVDSLVLPIAVAPGGSFANFGGRTVRRTSKLAVVEFTFPNWMRQAELRFTSVYLNFPSTSVIVDAI